MLDNWPKITIVTPVFNQEVYLEECILSILDQKYPNLEYIIIDGGSSDKTVEIIKKYSSHITYWISEKDNGLYEALQKGFSRSTGDIMGWLNSDDILHRKSLFIISEIFQKFNDINWLQGYPTVIDECGRIVFHRPQRFSKYSFYLKEYHDGIFIQQESTFWRRSLWDRAGAQISTLYKYAGDFELWMRFFRYEKLVCTNSLVGAFRMRSFGQISKVYYDDYILECDKIIDREMENLSVSERNEILKYNKADRFARKYSLISRLFPFRRATFNTTINSPSVNFDSMDQSFKLK
jgi:glycosyltransferase involved in cell wall biosynthesis